MLYDRADDTTTLGVRRATPDVFKEFMSSFPSGVTVLTTSGSDGTPYGLTCSSVCSVTVDPPTLLVCVDNSSRTLSTLLRRGVFALNLVHAAGRETATLFASPSDDRFASTAWRPTKEHGLPCLVEDAHAVAECRVTDAPVSGDHTIVVGEALTVATPAGEIPPPPLLYGLRNFATWPGADLPG